jgi:F-type H+-transporting ATPase subunit b
LDALRPLGIDPALLIAYVINFAILLLLLRLFLYRPILRMLNERRQKIQESLEQADKVRQEAEIQQAEFQRELEEARKTSQEEAARAAQEAEQIREQARQQIEVERQQTMAELQQQVAGLAVQLTRKVIGETVAVDEQAQRQLIQQFLQESGDLS